MLHDFKELMPQATVAGLDLSTYAVENALPSVKPFIQVADAKKLPYPDNSFDLAVSITSIHNLPLGECKLAIREIQRVSRRHAFLTVDAWRNDAERESLLKWNMTALTHMHVDEWKQIFDELGYRGDYYWFIAE